MDVVLETTDEITETNKRRKLDNPVTIAHDGGIVEVVLSSPMSMLPTNNVNHFTSGNHLNTNHSNQTTGNGNNNGLGNILNNSRLDANSTQNTHKDRYVPFDHSKTEQIALLTALSQVVSCTQDAVKILRESQERSLDLEHKRFRFQLEAEEKRLMMESEHYRKMENMFSTLIQAISQTPNSSAATGSPPNRPHSDIDQNSVSSPATVKVEIDT